MRAAPLLLALLACGPPAPPPAPAPAASLDVPPLPPPKASAENPVVRNAPPAPPPADPNDESPLPRDTAAAEIAFQEAKAAMAAGDLAKARALFLRSLRLDPAVGTLLNLALCEEKMGDKQNALRHYLAAEAEATKTGRTDRATFARERAAALR